MSNDEKAAARWFKHIVDTLNEDKIKQLYNLLKRYLDETD